MLFVPSLLTQRSSESFHLVLTFSTDNVSRSQYNYRSKSLVNNELVIIIMHLDWSNVIHSNGIPCKFYPLLPSAFAEFFRKFVFVCVRLCPFVIVCVRLRHCRLPIIRMLQISNACCLCQTHHGRAHRVLTLV